MTANKNAAFQGYCFSTNQRKKPESGFWTYDPTSKWIMPSFPASKYREEGHDLRLHFKLFLLLDSKLFLSPVASLRAILSLYTYRYSTLILSLIAFLRALVLLSWSLHSELLYPGCWLLVKRVTGNGVTRKRATGFFSFLLINCCCWSCLSVCLFSLFAFPTKKRR